MENKTNVRQKNINCSNIYWTNKPKPKKCFITKQTLDDLEKTVNIFKFESSSWLL